MGDFFYRGDKIRTVQMGGETWWVLKDICDVLRLTTPAKVAERLEEDEVSLVHIVDARGRRQETAIVNESGLHNVILRSNKPEAKNFKRWLLHQALPRPSQGTPDTVSLDSKRQPHTGLQVFTYEGSEVRTVQRGGETWWVLKDICDVLGLSDTGEVAERLDGDELTRIKHVSGGQTREMYAVNESGLYSVILRSNKPEAKNFKRWLTHEVLPSIRKHGAYLTPDKLEELISDPDAWIRVLTALKEERDAKERLQERVEEDKPKVLFADAVSASDDTILIGEMAKILKGNGVKTGRNRFFEDLRQDGYLIKRQGADRNTPTQKAMELGLFKLTEAAVAHPNGHVSLVKTTRVTGKGQQYFINRSLAKAQSPV
jgi:anti-repressor protein